MGGSERDRRHSSSGRKHKKSHKHDRKHKHSRKDERKKSSKTKYHLKSTRSTSGAVKLDLGNIRGIVPDRRLDFEVDYFQYHNHLRLFLFVSKDQTSFEDLTSDETHKIFNKFCQLYNMGELEEVYYHADLPDDLMRQVKRTNHSWKFKTSETERKALDYVKSGVKRHTEWNQGSDEGNRGEYDMERETKKSKPLEVSKKNQDDYTEDNRAKSRLERKIDNRKLKDRVRVANEEMHGIGEKKHGRERQLELKREQSFKQHAVAKQKDDLACGTEVSDMDIYGGSDDFKVALNREKKLKARLKEKKEARIEELRQKEDEKRQNMLQMLGLTNLHPGAKITIAPRNDSK